MASNILRGSGNSALDSSQPLFGKITQTQHGLLDGLLGGSGGGILGINLGDLLGGGQAGDSIGIDINLDGVIDGTVGVLDSDGDLIDIDLTLLEGLGDDDGVAGIDLDLDGVTDTVINIGGGQGGQSDGLVNVDLDLDGIIDGSVDIGDGELVAADLDILGGLGDNGLVGVDIDLDGVVDSVINIGGDSQFPGAGGLVGVDIDLDGIVDGSVGIGQDGDLVQADLDLLGGLGDDGLVGVDIDLDGLVDTVITIGGDGDGTGDGDGDGDGDGTGDGDGDGTGDGDGDGDGTGDGDGDGTGDGDGDGDGDGTGDGDGDGTGGGDGDGGGNGDGDGGGNGDGDGGVDTPQPGTIGFDLFKAYEEITRVSPTSSEAPTQEINLLSAIVNSVESGQITLKQALWQITGFADDTTSVATTSYQFFTGAVPTEQGLDYLVNAADAVNANDLNDAYYAQFNMANRYINFSANLAIGGEGRSEFVEDYGTLTFEQAVVKAYDTIFGLDEAQAAGYDTTSAINDILGRKAYFYDVAEERIGGNIELAAKAGLIGYLLNEAVKAELGVYGEGNAKFLFDLADGEAAFHTDLAVNYGPETTALLGQSSTDPGMYDTQVI